MSRGVDWRSILPTKLAATTTSLEESNNFRSFIYSQSSTNPANFVKIGPVDFELVGLKQRQRQNSIPPLNLEELKEDKAVQFAAEVTNGFTALEAAQN